MIGLCPPAAARKLAYELSCRRLLLADLLSDPAIGTAERLGWQGHTPFDPSD